MSFNTSLFRNLLLATLLCGARSASAYVLKQDSSGSPVQWSKSVEFVVDRNAAVRFNEPEAFGAIQAAVTAISHATPGLQLSVRQGTTKGLGYDDHGPNQNEVVIPDTWDFDKNSIAVTVLTVDSKSHRILDADIAFNKVHRKFRVLEKSQPGVGEYDDIQNVVTHELGHALGLAHNEADTQAVMYPGARRGEINKRTLTTDDEDGLLLLYPATGASALDGTGADPQTGCGSTSGGVDSGFLALLAAATLISKRRILRLVSMAGLLLPAAALASSRDRSPAEVDTAAVVVTGEVVSTRTLKLPNTKLLFTQVELKVRECLKGQCPKTITVIVPGGRNGNVEQIVEGQPAPENGGVIGVTIQAGEAGGALEAPTLKQTSVYRLDQLRDFAAFASGLQRARIHSSLTLPNRN